MRTYATPRLSKSATTGNLTDDVQARVSADAGHVAFRRPGPSGWTNVTAAQFRDDVVAVAKGLVAAGVAAGDRVALLSKTRYEWTVFDYATWWAGAVVVPIYETSSTEQISWILSDSAAIACVVETDAHLTRVAEVQPQLPELAHVWAIDGDAVDALAALGRDIPEDTLEARRGASGPDTAATLIYTSGTTGRPKGCVLTHGNFIADLDAVTPALPELFGLDDASTLLFLPLAHVFARIIQLGCVRTGVTMGHNADVKNLMSSLQEFQPTFLLAVPRVFEKVANAASQRATAEGRGRIFDKATETAIAFSRAQDANGPGLRLRLRHSVFDRLVYAKLRAALGGKLTYAVSGGAPLGERLAHYFRGIGVPVLEGYGLTETTAALSVNLPGDTKIGTVGRPVPGTEVLVADDGELLFRGGQVFTGYWHNPSATAEALEPDGWFHTGDIGEIDDEGFVRITGRKKEILVTAGGKNVAPAVLEDRLRGHPLVSQCMVVGDGKPFIAALVTLDSEVLGPWAAGHGKADDLAALATDPDLRAEIQRAVDNANSLVSKAESIRKFAILPVDWTEAAGQITPTLKLKRAVVMSDFHDDVEALYN